MINNYIQYLKTLLIVSYLLSFLPLQAQNQTELQSLSHVYNYAGASIVQLADPYLSVLNYTGYGARLEHSAYKYFNPGNPSLTQYHRLEGTGAYTLNPASTALITYLGANAAYGVLYEYRDLNNIVLHAGGNMDVDFAFKMNSRNINNPTNVDLSTNLNAMLGVRYDIPTKKRVLKLGTQIEFPMIGCMFVPYPGLTYYEMYKAKRIGEAIHFSSLHNKQGIKQRLTFDVPFNYTEWSFGVLMHLMKFQAGEQPYQLHEFSLFFGVHYDVIRFAGRKSKRPENFISPGL